MRPAWQRALARFVGRDHAHRDVARRDVVLQPLEHAPAVDVGQEDVERDRGRLVLARQRQRGGAERGDQALEALLARRVEQEARERRGRSRRSAARGRPGCDRVAVVADFVDQDGGLGCGGATHRAGAAPIAASARSRVGARCARRAAARLRSQRARSPRRRAGLRDGARRRVGLRQVQRERAAPAGRARPGGSRRRSRRDSSRLMARPRPVPPYLRLVLPSACWNASKMICCLSGGDADAGVGDREREHVGGAVQVFVVRVPAGAGRLDRRASPARGA